MVEQAQVQQPAVVESTGSLWGQALLWGAGWAALGGAAILVVAVLLEVPWWVPLLATIAAGGFGFFRGSGKIVQGHRDLLNRLVDVIEVGLSRDLNGNGVVGPKTAPTRVAYQATAPVVGLQPPTEATVPAQDRDEDDYDDRRDFGFFIDECWPAKGRIGRRFTWREWDNVPLPSGRTMGQELWESYCSRVEKCNLARRANSGPNATLISRATREQVLACLAQVIILPG